jgi:hypothetical protein
MQYEDAQEINSSQIWEKICVELDSWIANEMSVLKNCTQDRLPLVQQTIRDYERVKMLPQIVKERIE